MPNFVDPHPLVMSCPRILATVAHDENTRVLGCSLAALGVSVTAAVDTLKITLLALSIGYTAIKLVTAWLKLMKTWRARRIKDAKDDHDTDEFPL